MQFENPSEASSQELHRLEVEKVISAIKSSIRAAFEGTHFNWCLDDVPSNSFTVTQLRNRITKFKVKQELVKEALAILLEEENPIIKEDSLVINYDSGMKKTLVRNKTKYYRVVRIPTPEE